jgi:hypothetical protein
VVRIHTADGTPEYYSHRLLYSTEYETPSIQFGTFELACGLLVALLVSAATFLLLRPGSNRFQAGLAVALFHAAALVWLFSYFGFFSIHSNDEYHYLDTARKLLSPSAQFPEYPYPLGLPILYLPLLVFFRNPEPHLFAALFSFPNALIFGTGVILVIMALLRQSGASATTTRLTGAVLALFPVVVSAFHGSFDGKNVFALFLGMRCALPPDAEYMTVYNATDLIGYNALSDMPALFFGLLGLYLLRSALCQDPVKSLIPAALALAFALLIRLPSVFFLIPAAWLALQHIRRVSIGKLAAGALAGFCVLLPQFIWNTIMFGHPLTFGYKFRPEDFKGFQWPLVPEGNAMIGMLHYAMLAWGIAALLVLMEKKRFQTLAACLALLASSVLLFFAGYHGIGTALMRYPLPAIFALITLPVLMLATLQAQQRLPVVLAVLTPLILLPQIPFGIFMLPVPPWLFYTGTASCILWVWYRTRSYAWPAYGLLLLMRQPEIMLPAFIGTTLFFCLHSALTHTANFPINQEMSPNPAET